MHRWQLPAPGDLELVRAFLNTWSLTIATRTPRDMLPVLLQDARAWQAQFPDVQRCSTDSEVRLTQLRDDLREMLRGAPGWSERLNHWLRDLPLYATVEESAQGVAVRYDPHPEGGLVGRLLVTVVRAMQEGTWPRLKACPDCQVVFYDYTRSRTKVWCGMLAGGPDGRACGTIAKVKRYRQKHGANRRAQQEAGIDADAAHQVAQRSADLVVGE